MRNTLDSTAGGKVEADSRWIGATSGPAWVFQGWKGRRLFAEIANALAMLLRSQL